MKATGYLPTRLVDVCRVFREDWADRPERLSWALRFALTSLVIVFLSMTFQVPFLAVSVLVMFYGIQSNSLLTKMVGILFFAVTAVDVGSLLLILKLSYSYPLLRIVLTCLVLLFSLYMMRVFKLGIAFWAVAMVVGYGQTIPDALDFPDIAVRAILWAIVACLYPVVLMLVLNVWLFPAPPQKQLQREIRRQLADIRARLNAWNDPAQIHNGVTMERIEEDALALQKLHAICGMGDKHFKESQAYWKSCAAALLYLRTMLSQRPVLLDKEPDEAGKNLLRKLCHEIELWDQSVAVFDPYQTAWWPSAEEERTAQKYGWEEVCRTLSELGHFDLTQPAPPVEKNSPFLPDALTNPAYPRFALKVLLACMVCYVFYNSVQWPGIHTSLLTCIIVAYPSTGSSYQKMVLRFGGAVAGALLALTAAVFIIPYIDSIVSLLLLVAPVFLLGAWIAAGPERTAYFGTQMVFTFSMALLEDHFGPVSDLTEIRDRVIGIMIGITVSAVVYTLIWPENEADSLSKKLSALMHQLSRLFLRPEPAGGSAQLGYLQQRLVCLSDMVAGRQSRALAAMETHLDIEERARLLQRADGVLTQSRRLLDLDPREYLHESHRREPVPGRAGMQPDWPAWQARVSKALDHYAEGLAITPAQAIAPRMSDIVLPGEMAVSDAGIQKMVQEITALPDWASGETDTIATVPAKDANGVVT